MMRVLQISIFLLLMRVAIGEEQVACLIPLDLHEVNNHVLERTATFISQDTFITVYDEDAYKTKLLEMLFKFAILSNGLHHDPVPKERVSDTLFMDPLIMIKLDIKPNPDTAFNHIRPMRSFLPAYFYIKEKHYRFTFFRITRQNEIEIDYAFVTDTDHRDGRFSSLIAMYRDPASSDIGTVIFAENSDLKMGIAGFITKHMDNDVNSQGFPMINMDYETINRISSKMGDNEISNILTHLTTVTLLRDYIPDLKHLVPIVVRTEEGTDIRRLCSSFIHKNFALTDASLDITNPTHKILFRFNLVDASLNYAEIRMSEIGMFRNKNGNEKYSVMVLPENYAIEYAGVNRRFVNLYKTKPQKEPFKNYIYFYGSRKIREKEQIFGDSIANDYEDFFNSELHGNLFASEAEDVGSFAIKPVNGADPLEAYVLGLIYAVDNGEFRVAPVVATNKLLRIFMHFMSTSTISANLRYFVNAVRNGPQGQYQKDPNLQSVFTDLFQLCTSAIELCKAIKTIETAIKMSDVIFNGQKLTNDEQTMFSAAVSTLEKYLDF